MTSAKIIADSIAPNGKRITTFELEFHRFILAEFNTHRMISKNAASSRAIPLERLITTIQENTAYPVTWGKNEAGMSASTVLDIEEEQACRAIWEEARDGAIVYARRLAQLGLHKQNVNRLIENFGFVKVVATATEWDNFFHLCCHKDAQPEFQCLAKMMYLEYSQSIPKNISIGDWHLPYVSDEDRKKYSLEECKKLSASLCAQVSYRKSDESIEKALMIYDRLVGQVPKHSSPFEHQATPLLFAPESSGNFKGWEQHRHQISDNTCYSYKP